MAISSHELTLERGLHPERRTSMSGGLLVVLALFGMRNCR
jgi:hypothetical protein